jgi:dTDP-4-dehydrorhamnose reductase
LKIAITGAGGQLGRELARTAPAQHVVALLAHRDCDIGDPASVRSMLERERPDVVINAAAYTAVDKAESEPEVAARNNALGPLNLAAGTHRLLQVSTDFVFDGAKGSAYLPDDATNPLCVYGRTKLEGEGPVLALGARGIVLRTSWVYSSEGNNFVKTMLRLMENRPEIGVVADQIAAPTWARGLAQALWRIVAKPDLHGIHHWRDAGVASWYDFATAIAEEAQSQGLLARPVKVKPIGTRDYPTPARRPAFSLLDCSATWGAIGTPPHWRTHLQQMFSGA